MYFSSWSATPTIRLDKIVAFVQEQKESSSELETKSDINFVIPCKIVLKNTVFHVSQNENIVNLKLPTITLRQKIDEYDFDYDEAFARVISDFTKVDLSCIMDLLLEG
mgnify:CR=1 FL=1